MRLCISTREYRGISSYTGGIGTTYSRLAPAFARHGHEVHLVSMSLDGDASRRAREQGIELHAIHDDAERPRLRAPVDFDRAIRRLGAVDVVLAPEWGGDTALFAMRRDRPPLVTNLRTSLRQALAVSPGAPRPLGRQLVRNTLQRSLERVQAQRSEALLGVSAAVLQWAREMWRLDGLPGYVLPNGIDVAASVATAAGPSPPGFPADGRPTVVFAGRLETRKGVAVLARAMGSVWSELPDVDLVLVGADARYGTGMMSDYVLSQAESHRDRVHLLGGQPMSGVLASFRHADVVVLPSLWEAFGNVAVESAALGRPTIFTVGSGFDEILRDGVDGVGVEPGDPVALARAVSDLLKDPERRQTLGAAAAQRAQAFDVDLVATRYVDVLERIVGGEGTTPRGEVAAGRPDTPTASSI